MADGKNEDTCSARTLQKNGLLKAELSQYGYEAFIKELKAMLEWNPLNMQDSGLKTAITDSCVLMKKQGSQSKVIQLTEEGMKAISDD